MEEVTNTTKAIDSTSLKVYKSPTLTPLGSIHSLVQGNPGSGHDGGLTNANSAS